MAADLQLLVFDTRRGNHEGQEEDKLLAFYPPTAPPVHQSGLAGLLQGLLLFTANFVDSSRPHWEVAETDSGTWVMHEPEPHVWFAALAPRAWLPRHATEHSLRALLAQMHLLASLLCGTVQGMLEEDPSGGLARCCLQAVTQRLGAALGSPHSWQHRELRNPLGDAALPPALQLSPAGALALQSFANQLLQAAPGGQRLVHGLLLLYGPHLLWSSLPPRDTAALFALISTGLLHARASSGGSGANGGVGDTAAAAPLDLRPLDGGGWQQLPSGFLALRDSLDAAITGEGAPAVQVPLVHLQQAPSPDQAGGQGQQAAAQAGQPMLAQPTPLQPCHLLPLLEGKLLVGLLLEGSTPLTSQLLAALHSLLAAPTRQMAAQVGEEVRLGYKGEAAHLPGFRYLHQDTGLGQAHASPRVKVSAMSHHARTLAAAVRDSLGPLPGQVGGALEQQAASAGAAGEEEADKRGGGGDSPASAPLEGQQQGSPAVAAAAAAAAHQGSRGDHEVLEVLAKSSQDVWAAGWRPGGGRQLLAVREQRSERELQEAGEVMGALAAQHFFI